MFLKIDDGGKKSFILINIKNISLLVELKIVSDA